MIGTVSVLSVSQYVQFLCQSQVWAAEGLTIAITIIAYLHLRSLHVFN